jgi:prepilin-type N-terminal cleavage/methylation domain-containing protein
MRRRRGGLTVIEMVVVIALIGIMAGVVAPSIVSSPGTMTSESAVDRVDGLLQVAREKAIDRARRVNVVIDPATGQFWLDFPETTGVIALPEGETLLSPSRRVHIQFEPTGETSAHDALFVRRGDTTIGVRFDR